MEIINENLIIYKDKKYVAVPSTNTPCSECVCKDFYYCDCIPCTPKERKDKQNVYFKLKES